MKKLFLLAGLGMLALTTYAQNTNPWPSSGNVGIGTNSPSQTLTVNGKINILNPTGGEYIGFGVPGSNEYNTIGSFYSSAGLTLAHGLKPDATSSSLVYSFGNMGRSAIVLGDNFTSGGIKFYTKPSSVETVGNLFSDAPRMIIQDDGNIGVGMSAPVAALHVKGIADDNIQVFEDFNSSQQWSVFLDNNDFSIRDFTNNRVAMTILNENGNIGIGTMYPAEKLSVNGTIRSKEVKVETANWPDYVFEEGYKVEKLEELESFIKTNKHLPGIPSAKEVEKEGISLGEMNARLLQKIEEMTLQMIEMNKQMKEQGAKIKDLEQQLNRQKK